MNFNRVTSRMYDFLKYRCEFKVIPVFTLFFSIIYSYLWSTTEVHITADGAANRLFTMFSEDRDLFIPDYIMVV